MEGETIADRIARGPIPASEAVPLFIQIARGLEAAHNGYLDWGFNYDLFRDGQRFLMVKAGPPLKLCVPVNWFSELKRASCHRLITAAPGVNSPPLLLSEPM